MCYSSAAEVQVHLFPEQLRQALVYTVLEPCMGDPNQAISLAQLHA